MEFESSTIVFLYSADDAPEMGEEERRAVRQAHLDHQTGLARRGLVVIAGPFDQASDERLAGMSVLSVDPDEALRLYANDPAVKAGLLCCEAAVWWRFVGGAEFRNVVEAS
jgi:uncharacterized protein YciI